MKGLNTKRAAISLVLLFGFLASHPIFAETGKERLTIAYAAVNPTVLPLWIAMEKGFFDSEGLDLQFVYIRTSPTMLSAIVSGDIEAAYTGGTAVLNGAARGIDLQIVANTRTKLTYDIVARPEIKKPADLRGKVFAVQALGGTVWMGAVLGLEYLGLDPARDNIKLIPFGDQNLLAQALEARKIDATVLDKPVSTELKRKGFVFLCELSKSDIPFTGTGLTFRRSFIQRRAEAVRRTVRALVRASAFIFYPPNKTEVIETIVRKLGFQNHAGAANTYDAVLQTVTQKPYPSIRGLENIQRLLGRLNPDIAKVSPETVVDMTFMDELGKSGFIDKAMRTGGKAP
ncbi:MAG: ABC transporter substrate-binding protein [Deltaproteobacteria bacterium]|nr:ABC transporter substrate-binding protein [Deltaproteobacteria bacterium]